MFVRLSDFFSEHPEYKISAHGMDHSIKVADHVKNILKEKGLLPETEFDETKQEWICVTAAYLHDINDHKLLPEGEDYLAIFLSDNPFEAEIRKIIDQVSYSSNRNNVCSDEALYVRLADRIESIDFDRCMEYTRYVGRPVFIPGSPVYATAEEVNQHLGGYTGKSRSAIDHILEKILVIKYETGIAYVDEEMGRRHDEVMSKLLSFYRTVS